MNFHVISKLIWLIAFFIVFSVSDLCTAGRRITWDYNENADYYMVFWGSTQENSLTGASSEIPSSDELEYEIPDSVSDQTLYFAVKAYNFCGNSSDLSELIYVEPSQYPKNSSEACGCFVVSLN